MLAMRMVDPLNFTEHHRFIAYRDFSLGPLEQKMLTGVYQPMIGGVAAGLYSLLIQQLPAERSGFSQVDLQRKLFQGLDIDPNERGRRALIDSFSRLEAVGLVQTTRLDHIETEEQCYEYRLFPPLMPEEFRRTQHLFLLLRDKIGARALDALMAELVADKPGELRGASVTGEDLSVPFYEVFTLGGGAHREAEVKGARVAIAKLSSSSPSEANNPARSTVRFRYVDIIKRFPKISQNRRYVERLEHNEQDIASVNYIADKYGLTLKELSQLLEEDGVFNIRGVLLGDELDRRAHASYMQRHKRDDERNWGLVERLNAGKIESAAGLQETVAGATVAIAQELGSSAFDVPDWMRDRFDPAAYNAMLASEPYTKILQLFIAENVSAPTMQLFSKLSIYYRIPDPVLNALIHHMRVCNLPWKSAYIEKIASGLQGEQIISYGQAVSYFLKEADARSNRKERQEEGLSGTNRSERKPAPRPSGRATGKQRPKLPVHRPAGPARLLTEEEEVEFEQMIRQLEKG